MALTNEEILEAIASKTVLEISELIKMMEEKVRCVRRCRRCGCCRPGRRRCRPG